jgi:TPP-dependent pyruvate/acetoin dehydrogenase alpha subunit
MEGFWTVEFRSGNVGVGSGVAVFLNGKVFGGDGAYTYQGTYTHNGGRVTATIQVAAFLQNAPNVFGIPNRAFEIQLNGAETAPGNINAQGQITGLPQFRIEMRLTKRANL